MQKATGKIYISRYDSDDNQRYLLSHIDISDCTYFTLVHMDSGKIGTLYPTIQQLFDHTPYLEELEEEDCIEVYERNYDKENSKVIRTVDYFYDDGSGYLIREVKHNRFCHSSTDLEVHFHPYSKGCQYPGEVFFRYCIGNSEVIYEHPNVDVKPVDYEIVFYYLKEFYPENCTGKFKELDV